MQHSLFPEENSVTVTA